MPSTSEAQAGGAGGGIVERNGVCGGDGGALGAVGIVGGEISAANGEGNVLPDAQCVQGVPFEQCEQLEDAGALFAAVAWLKVVRARGGPSSPPHGVWPCPLVVWERRGAWQVVVEGGDGATWSFLGPRPSEV